VRSLAILLVALPLGWTLIAHAQKPPPTAAERVERGKQVYAREKCATCHQIARKGNSRFPLDGVGSKLTAEQLRRWITDTAKMEDALPRMPAVRMSATKYHLSPADLAALVAYLETLKDRSDTLAGLCPGSPG
jgi:mono/diheme cytochrome c family protein